MSSFKNFRECYNLGLNSRPLHVDAYVSSNVALNCGATKIVCDDAIFQRANMTSRRPILTMIFSFLLSCLSCSFPIYCIFELHSPFLTWTRVWQYGIDNNFEINIMYRNKEKGKPNIKTNRQG
jgi:hypothetical protein